MAGVVYRVLGPRLGNGACAKAASEQQAIGIVAGVFGLDPSRLTAIRDINARIPVGEILTSSGETISIMPSVSTEECTPSGSLWRTVDAMALSKRRLLIVEDEYFVATVIRNHLEAAGATIVAMVATIDGAIQAIRTSSLIDAAIVDINLQGVKVYAVADMLPSEGIPFVISTAYDDWVFCSRYPEVPVATNHTPWRPWRKRSQA
jgi:hypothetical protein